jgi:hypothetical protein
LNVRKERKARSDEVEKGNGENALVKAHRVRERAREEVIVLDEQGLGHACEGDLLGRGEIAEGVDLPAGGHNWGKGQGGQEGMLRSRKGERYPLMHSNGQTAQKGTTASQSSFWTTLSRAKSSQLWISKARTGKQNATHIRTPFSFSTFA